MRSVLTFYFEPLREGDERRYLKAVKHLLESMGAGEFNELFD